MTAEEAATGRVPRRAPSQVNFLLRGAGDDWGRLTLLETETLRVTNKGTSVSSHGSRGTGGARVTEQRQVKSRPSFCSGLHRDCSHRLMGLLIPGPLWPDQCLHQK